MMPKSLNANVVTKLASSDGVLYPRLLLKLAFDAGDGGDTNIWNGIGDLTYNSDTYSGVGNFGTLTDITEPGNISQPEVEAQLNGIPSEIISLALGAEYQGRLAYIYMAFFDSDHTLAGDTYVENVFTGTMEQLTPVTVGGETDSIVLRMRSYFAEFENTVERKYTSGDWLVHQPGDNLCSFVARMSDRDTVWEET